MSDLSVADVDQRARAEGTPDESRQLYVQEIFDWTDSYNENLSQMADSPEAKLAVLKLTELWIAYANYEISLKQWKKAVQIYDDSLQDELVSKHSKIYVAYAHFCKSRNKQSNALKTYVRGLKAGLSDEHYDKIWIEFSGFMSTTSSEKLSFDELYSALSQQVDTPLKKPSQLAIDIIEGRALAPTEDLPEKPIAVKEEPAAIVAPPVPPPFPPPVRPIAAVESAPSAAPDNYATGMPMEVADEALADIKVDLVDVDNMTGFKYPDDCKLYQHRPPSLFSSPDTEPMVSGLDTLSPAELKTVESYFQVKGLDQYQEQERESFYERVLDILEGMWYAQALKERHFDVWFAELIRKHTSYENDIQRNHGRNDTRKFELERLRQKNSLQINLLNVIINKILFSLLKEQQSILQSIKFPFFDQILAVSSLAELDDPKLAVEMEVILKQKRVVSAILSLRLRSKAASLGGMSSDGKKRKKTRRRFSSEGALDSVENSPVAGNASFAAADVENPQKRARLDVNGKRAGAGVSRFSSAEPAEPGNYGPTVGGSMPHSQAIAPTLFGTPRPQEVPAASVGPAKSQAIDPRRAVGSKADPDKVAAAANIDPASLPLLLQLAKLLKKGAKK